MKVLMLGSMPNPDYPNKGIFNQRAAQSIGAEVELIVVSIRTWKPGRKFKVVEEFDQYKVLHLAIPHKPSMSKILHLLNQRIWTYFTLLLARKELKNVDLVHSVSGGYGYTGALISSSKSIPHVLQLTGSDVNSEYPKLLNSKQVELLLQNTHRVVGNSFRLATDFQKLFGSSISGTQIYRGTNLKNFSFKRIVDVQNNFLFIGGLDLYPFYTHRMNTKGGITLMKAWKEAEEELHELKAKLWFGGPSTPNDVLEEWKSTLKYPDSVVCIGSLRPESVVEAYLQARFVLLPSMEEGLPNVAVESSAMGRIVIGSNVGGIPEVVEDQNSGFIFDAGNEMDLAQKLTQAARLTKEKRTELSENARRRIEESFDAVQYGAKYHRLYKEVCAE